MPLRTAKEMFLSHMEEMEINEHHTKRREKM